MRSTFPYVNIIRTFADKTSNINLQKERKTLMIKTLRFSLFSLLVMLCTAMSAQKTVTFDFTGDEAYNMTLLSGSTSEYNTDPYICTEGDITLTLKGNTRWWKANGGNQLRFYKNSSFTLAAPTGSVITSIVLTATAPANFSASVGSYESGTWTGSANSVDFSCTISKSNTPITKMEVTYQSSSEPTKKAPGLAFSENLMTGVAGQAFTAPTLTKETTAAVAYSSNNEEVATVDAQSGDVTLLAAGTVVITATAEENDEYSAGSASYTITVSAPVYETVSVPYTETFATDKGSFTYDNVTLPEALTYVWTIDTYYKCAKASAYKSGTNYATESWLVSPWIELDNDVIDSLAFDQAISKYFGTVSEEATLWIKAKDGDWKQVAISYPVIADGKSFSSFETTTISLEDYAGQSIKVGFKYASTDSNAGTWEINNFKVTKSAIATAISTVKADAEANAPIYNLAGQRLVKMQKGLNIVGGKKVIKK